MQLSTTSGDAHPKVIAKDFVNSPRRASSLSRKDKGKKKEARVERDFDAAFSTANSRTVAKVRLTVAKPILLEKMENPLKCFICDSIEHFRADCPQGPGKGKTHLASERDQSRGTTGGWAPTIQLAICVAQGTARHYHVQSDVAETPQPVVAEYVSEYEHAITSDEMSWPIWRLYLNQ